MKKFLPLWIILFFLTEGAFAQFSFGVLAGVNNSSQTGIPYSLYVTGHGKPSSAIGYQAGAYFLFRKGKLGLQPEVYLSSVGTKLSEEYPPGYISSSTVNYTYLYLPILLRYNILDMLNVQLGPQIGTILDGKVATSYNYMGSSGQHTESTNNSIADLSVAAGVGTDLPFGLSAGLRYVTSITSMSKTESIKNTSFQFYVGYKLVGHVPQKKFGD